MPDPVRLMLEELWRDGAGSTAEDHLWIRRTRQEVMAGNVLSQQDEIRIEEIWKSVRSGAR